MGKMGALCSGSLRTAELLTPTPFVSSSSFPSPVCVVVVITPASTCPSRWQGEQKWDMHLEKHKHFIIEHQHSSTKEFVVFSTHYSQAVCDHSDVRKFQSAIVLLTVLWHLVFWLRIRVNIINQAVEGMLSRGYLTSSILRVRHVPWVWSLKRFLIPNSSPLWTSCPCTASKYRRALSLPTTELCNCWK